MQHLQNGLYYSGTSGLVLPIPKYAFPPPYENVSRLTYYATFFNSLEINSSFYKIPRPATVAKWETSVTEYFKFTFKLWQGITHVKDLNFNEEDVVAFFKSINAVNNKRGCLLIQFPPSLGIAYKTQLNRLLGCIKKIDTNETWKVAVEFRNTSWYHEDVYDIMNFHKAALVVHDMPKSATPFLKHQSHFMYIRFHGPIVNYSGSYSEDFLKEYATYLNEWIEEGKSVYVYFNNTVGEAFNNLQILNKLNDYKISVT